MTNEFKALTDELTMDGYVEMLTGKKSMSYAALYNFMIDKIQMMLKSDVNRKLYSLNRRVFFNLAFGNPEVTEFFMKHPTLECA